MSHTKRRSEDSGKGKKGSRRRAPAAGASAAGSPAVTSLPAFGFAEDLLGAAAAAEPAPVEAGGEAAVEDPPSADPAPGFGHPGSGHPGSDAGPEAPDRVFTFADSLKQAVRGEAEEQAPEVLTSWVTFGLAEEVFALPVEPIREVLRVTSITRVPHAPQPIRGVTNLRGRVIPVIDLRLRIDLEAKDLDRASRVIVVGSQGRLLGLLVDVVHQVVHIDLNQVQPPPEDVMTVQSDYILGVYHRADQLILLFDVDRALIIKEPSPQPTTQPTEEGNR